MQPGRHFKMPSLAGEQIFSLACDQIFTIAKKKKTAITGLKFFLAKKCALKSDLPLSPQKLNLRSPKMCPPGRTTPSAHRLLRYCH